MARSVAAGVSARAEAEGAATGSGAGSARTATGRVTDAGGSAGSSGPAGGGDAAAAALGDGELADEPGQRQLALDLGPTFGHDLRQLGLGGDGQPHRGEDEEVEDLVDR